MINLMKEGGFKKVGLNLYRARGGFVVGWVWYEPKTYELKTWRFRLRMHMKPHILWSFQRSNVVQDYLFNHDLDLVSRETLMDLKALEDDAKRTNEPLAYIKPLQPEG